MSCCELADDIIAVCRSYVCTNSHAIASVSFPLCCSYVCINPGGGPGSDIILSYPQHDPQSIKEYFGVAMQDDAR